VHREPEIERVALPARGGGVPVDLDAVGIEAGVGRRQRWSGPGRRGRGVGQWAAPGIADLDVAVRRQGDREAFLVDGAVVAPALCRLPDYSDSVR